MNKTCARCQKVVYPIEELKCLDKTWHKTCFRCSECGMMLNMKTYKGYNKLPYCEAHIPKAKATAIADTPELKRIAENTKIQSNVKYHADFEKAKGKFTQVADDPETLRIKQNTKHISNVAYHGDLEKKAAMEKQREAAEVADSRGATSSPSSSQHHHSNQQQQNLASYQGNVPTAATISAQVQQSTPNNYNQLRSSILQNSHHPTGAAIIDSAVGPTSPSSVVSPYSAYDQYDNYARPAATYNNNNSNINNNHAVYQQQQQLQQQQQQLQQQQLQQKPYQQQQQQPNQPTAAQQLYASNTFGNLHQSGTSLAAGSTASTTSNTASHQSNGSGSGIIQNGSGGNSGANISANNIGKIADYDPLTDGPRQIPNTSRPATTLIYSSESRGSVNSAYPKRVGSIADIDPANGIYGSIAGDNLSAHSIHHQQSQQQQQQQYYQQMQLMQQQQQQQQQALQQHDQQLRQQQSQQQLHQTQSKPSLRIYRALYDYVAQDVDEVSFREGDVIFEVDSIDSGWMTGRVERTGKTGMLPANYVEHAVI